MRIVRPYGKSETHTAWSDGSERHLVRNTFGRERTSIELFAKDHDELVIAQWISEIDKIASKPSGSTGATKRQREFRDRLGVAAFSHLSQNGLLPGLASGRADYLAELWKLKIHPYGKSEFRPRFVRGKQRPEPKPEGRLFRKFSEYATPEDADVGAIINRIHSHLYKSEFRACHTLPPKSEGRILLRAKSIARNVLKRSGSDTDQSLWSDIDQENYAAAGDVAAEIRKSAEERENQGRGGRAQRVTVDVAGRALYVHWSRVFRCEDRVLSMTEAENIDQYKSLVTLHKAVRETYARLLKRHSKDRPDHQKGRASYSRRPVSSLLPKDMKSLFQLIGKQQRNRALSDLVRFGKVIHYSSNPGTPTTELLLGEHVWRTDLKASEYWTSSGQSLIKREEAFVRAWRGAIALASRTLKDWVDHDDSWTLSRGSDHRDILMSHREIGEEIFVQKERFDLKLSLLFGEHYFTFPNELSDRHSLLKQIIHDCYNLRNLVFHFKGRERFVKGLEALGSNKTDPLEGLDRAIWESDCRKQNSVLVDTLNGARLCYFTKEGRARYLIKTISGCVESRLPLPRFNRVLARVRDAWQREKTVKPILPPPVNRIDLENPARNCQYICLKLLYDRVFGSWLEEQSGTQITDWIDKAVSRSTRAATAMNVKKGEPGLGVIVSRAANLPRPNASEGIDTFFFDLTAATASEMRVQRGYTNDAESAKRQARYIEDLKCDVLALAFSDFLMAKGFSWLQNFDVSREPRERASFEISEIQSVPPDIAAENWQHRLYFLLHLIPVDEVSRLQHQLAKWETTSRKEECLSDLETDRIAKLRRCLSLYIDMHDAKFSGGSQLAGLNEFRDLFEDQAAFEAVFPKGDAIEEGRVPRRGLREIARFGDLANLKALFASSLISVDEIERVRAFESAAGMEKSEIGKLQEEREDLHRAWTESRRSGGFPASKVERYVEVLKSISEHRQLSNRVNLIDHSRAHSLILALIGRVIDYIGLFERDLYFATLAIIYDLGVKPEEVFKPRGYLRLQEGRILEALTQIRAESEEEKDTKSKLHTQLAEHFTNVFDTRNTVRKIRNRIAHLEVFGPEKPLNFTEVVNDLRLVMSYDRKLKNAVAKSVREVLFREGFDLIWKADTKIHPHRLAHARVQVKSATHLGGLKLSAVGSASGTLPPQRNLIQESLHSPELVKVVSRLFDGQVDLVDDISSWELGSIDFEEIDRNIEQRRKRKSKSDARSSKPRRKAHPRR